MLNLSENKVSGKFDKGEYQSFFMTREYEAAKVLSRILKWSFAILLILLFLPWTQNIRSRGYITTLQPEQRPQTINSVIAGRIEEWFVREGDYVYKGDTILQISEIKDDYFDPRFVERAENQVDAKSKSFKAYGNKIAALKNQLQALIENRELKLQQATNYIEQARLKVESDSIDLVAANTALEIANRQYARYESLYDQGLKSLTDLEARKLKLQEAQAKQISATNKLLASKNMLINARVEYNAVANDYRDKIAKAESEIFSSESDMANTESEINKLANQASNYRIRTGMYFITAQQEGYVTKAIRSGIGETVKEGEQLVSIMPGHYDLAVAMFVKPMDLPLINKGQHVRFMFDGWPTIIFSGWPNLSYGTFGGEVVAIDNFISENGMYRMLVAPDKNDHPWPEELRVGSGADGIALLKDVPIWYEIWRKLNGFPPDYYNEGADKTNDPKTDKK